MRRAIKQRRNAIRRLARAMRSALREYRIESHLSIDEGLIEVQAAVQARLLHVLRRRNMSAFAQQERLLNRSVNR